MPASRSTARAPEPATPSRLRWPLIILGLLIVAAFVVSALPASLLTRLLPPVVQAQDLSGTIWHGSAGSLIVSGHNAGAIEWRLQPRALLSLTVISDVHWVKTSSSYDARVEASRHAVHAYQVHGGGPVDDLRDFGLPPGWRGNIKVALSELSSDFRRITALEGSIEVSELSSPRVLSGSDLGGYQLTLAPGAVGPDGNLSATLADTGGPLETRAQISLNLATGTGLLTGTLKERAGASAALHEQLENLAQLKPRDAQGRIPVDLEISL